MTSINLIIKPTDACNLRCRHCYASETGYSSAKMDLSTVKKIFDIFTKDYDEIRVIWHGGEPLLMGIDFYKEVIEIQSRYSSKKFSNSLQSNATLLTKEWLDFFIENKIKLGISFDGQFNDILRNNTTQVIKAMNLMKRADYQFGLICVICEKTVDKLIDIYEYFKLLGLSYKINPLFASGEANKHSSLNFTNKKFIREYIKFFEYWLEDKECNIEVGTNLEYLSLFLGNNQTLCTYTSCLTRWLGIHHNGDIFPCGRSYPDSYKIENIHNIFFSKEIFSSSSYNFLLEGAIKRRSLCEKKCDLYSKCHGGCNNNAIIAGDISNPNNRECRMFREITKKIDFILQNKLKSDSINNLNPTATKVIHRKIKHLKME